MDIQLKKKPWYIKYLSYIVVGTAFLGLVIYLCVSAFGPHRVRIDAEDYRIAEVTESPFIEYLDVEGIVQPIRVIQVNALESGFVDRIVAEEGTIVKKGDTILTLNNVELVRSIEDEETDWNNRQREFQEREIEMEQHSLTLRQQALEAEHQLASLDKSLHQSREEFRMGIKSKAELAVAEEENSYHHKKIKLQMESLHHDSLATNLRRETIRSNRETSNGKLSRMVDRLGNLVVRAPVDGQLSFLNVTLGQQVAGGGTIGEIKVMSEYKMRVSLPEYYIDRIVTGLPATVAYQEKRYPLKISRVVPEIKDRNFSCDLVFTGEMPSNARLGKSYRVKVEMARPEPAVVIPRGDFYQTNSGTWVYRLTQDGKKARKTKIELGRQNPEQFEVLSGLAPGDQVIVNGYERLGDSEELLLK